MPDNRDNISDWVRKNLHKLFHPKKEIPLPKPPPPPKPKPTSGKRYRIKTDREIAEWNFGSRTADPEWRRGHPRMAQAPQTARIHLVRENGKAGQSQYALPPEWQAYVKSINTPEAFRYLTRDGSGWVNRPSWPIVQAVLFRDEEFVAARTHLNRVYIKGADIALPPEGQAITLIEFTVVREDGATVDPPCGPCRLPIVFPGEAWIDISELVES